MLQLSLLVLTDETMFEKRKHDYRLELPVQLIRQTVWVSLSQFKIHCWHLLCESFGICRGGEGEASAAFRQMHSTLTRGRIPH